MTEPKYKVGDLVKIFSEPWNQFAGDIVQVTKVEKRGDTWCYDFLIPERRGGAPEHLIYERVGHMKLFS